MQWLLSLATSLTCVFACCAQDVDQATAKARAAFALAKLSRDVTAASDATSKAAGALKKRQEDRDTACLSDLGEAIALANKTGRPLFVWVGMTCVEQPEIRAAFKDAVHAHADRLNGIAEPRLLVRPVGANVATPFLQRNLSPASISAIKSALTPGRVSVEAQTYPVTQFRPRATVIADC